MNEAQTEGVAASNVGGNSATGVPFEDGKLRAIRSKHLAMGWWTLLVFLSFGIVLEALHGFKLGSYLNVSAAPRRLMWTLAHAHGTLLALVHIAFAWTAGCATAWPVGPRQIASICLSGAGVLLPAGFFLGGLFIKGGDPGFGVLLVPVGALLLLISVFVTARHCRRGL